MADSTNSIIVQVVDVVSPEIAPKLVAIASASDRAAVSVISLADAMATLKGAGLGSLSTMLDKMETSTLKASVAQATLATRIQATTASTQQLAAAQGTVAGALQATAAASRANQNATVANTTATGASSSATRGMVSANVSAAAGLGILEGRTLSMNRAAANFITRILGMGSALQSAFVVIGAVAVIDVLYQMEEGLRKVVKGALDASSEMTKAFDSVTNPLRKANDELALTNDKLDRTIATLLHRPSNNGVAMALDEARVMADKLDDSLERVQNDLGNVLNKNQVGLFGGLFTNQATTGGTSDFIQRQYAEVQAAQDRARNALDTAQVTKDPNASRGLVTAAYNDERASIVKVVSAIEAEYNLKKKLNDMPRIDMDSMGHITAIRPDQTANLTELGKAGHLAQTELRNLDLTMQNIVKTATVDKLHDQLSGESATLKQAAKDWKALEAAFVQYNTSVLASGQKPTAQQDLSWLQSQKINPLNADKLAAKELPFQSKIQGDKDWTDSQSSHLRDQVAEIGLYSDALKEAAKWNLIKQEADRRGIVFTDLQTVAMKSQIATIVESNDYQKELASEFELVSSAKDTYAGKTQALSTLLRDGILSQDQYSQSLARTTRDYNEASSAVVAFQRQLDEQKRDAGDKLGSNSDISAMTELHTLAEAMRIGDASHPGGYKEDDITAALASKREGIKAQLEANSVAQAANKLIFDQVNLVNQLTINEKARTAAIKAGALSLEAANSARNRDSLQLNDSQLKNGTGGSVLKGSIGSYAKEFTTLASGIESAFKPVFATLSDGFADSLGRSIVYAKNLGSALKDVAKSAVSELISGLVKLGVQQVIQLAEGTAAATAATATSVALAQPVGVAWAGPAMAASIATFGAADAIGAAAYAGAQMAAIAAASVPKLATGTNYLPGDMLIQAHKGERVIPAADNTALIGALSSGGGRGGPMKVEVHNYGSAKIETQQIDEHTVRLIVRDEGRQIVAQHAPGAIATELSNPNSKVSKSLSNNTYATRRR